MSTSPASDADLRPLRADAERNRLKIIAAARELFAERGLDVSMDDVAAHAGVGVGTVYRRFDNRDELIIGVFTEHLKGVAGRTRDALDDPDPWAAVVDLLTWFCSVIAEDRGLAAIMMRIDHSHPDIEAVKSDLTGQMEEVFARAKSAGVLRPDVASTDFFSIFTMISAVADVTRPVVPGAWRRYLELLLRAIHADPAHDVLTTPPLTDDQIRAIQQARAAS
ncbi:TetR/AcrR family transcriptional regulator [Gordonia insulae]|uniref:HTH-type transcriptional repressor Bm3R1 n=1 Tax=Gordonia insulae TaxID=2420509 RepID=A0A3G8JKG0_9ACTN|nr:TetR/AcrR family transcriptional regulator [Gordonia insulae]AZG45105.1 HTH-type transcriptional repressor Bm3R1 [Gordonia insulae]